MQRRFTALVIILILCVLLTASCTKDRKSVWDIQAQPYVRSDGTMGLSLYMVSSSEAGESVQMVVKDPSGHLTWSFNAVSARSGNTTYIGSPNIRMPAGSDLPQGTWSVDVLYRDGTTVTKEFSVSYEDSFEIPGDLVEAVFDSETNLTFVPVPEQAASDEPSDLSV